MTCSAHGMLTYVTSNVPRDRTGTRATDIEQFEQSNLSAQFMNTIAINTLLKYGTGVLVPVSPIGCNGFAKNEIRMEFGPADS